MSLELQLYEAVVADKTESVSKLLRQGANPNLPVKDGENALHAALLNLSNKSLFILLQHESTDPNLPFKDEFPLCIAIKRPNPRAVEILLENHKINPNLRSKVIDNGGNICLKSPLAQVLELPFISYESIARLLLNDPRTDPNVLIEGDAVTETNMFAHYISLIMSAKHSLSDAAKYLPLLLANPRLDLSQETHIKKQWYKWCVEYFCYKIIPSNLNSYIFFRFSGPIFHAVGIHRFFSNESYDFQYVSIEERVFIVEIIRNFLNSPLPSNYSCILDEIYNGGRINEALLKLKAEINRGGLFVFKQIPIVNFSEKILSIEPAFPSKNWTVTMIELANKYETNNETHIGALTAINISKTKNLQDQIKLIIRYRLRCYLLPAHSFPMLLLWSANPAEELYEKHLSKLLKELMQHCIMLKYDFEEMMSSCLREPISAQDKRTVYKVIVSNNSKGHVQEKLMSEFGEKLRNIFTKIYLKTTQDDFSGKFDDEPDQTATGNYPLQTYK
ncbi:MAG: ankyrin repeat domain-containing protein [Taibaiella sp.]|jgi:hypothetical protein